MNLSSQSPDIAAVSAVPLATVDQLREGIRRKSKLKGRQTEDASLEEVRALIGARPAEGHRRDQLIEICTCSTMRTAACTSATWSPLPGR